MSKSQKRPPNSIEKTGIKRIVQIVSTFFLTPVRAILQTVSCHSHYTNRVTSDCYWSIDMSSRIYIILVHGRKRRPETRGLCFGKNLRKAKFLAWKELNIVQLIKGCKGMLWNQNGLYFCLSVLKTCHPTVKSSPKTCPHSTDSSPFINLTFVTDYKHIMH